MVGAPLPGVVAECRESHARKLPQLGDEALQHQEPVPSAEERISLMSTDTSLMAPEEPAAPHRLAEFQNFSLDDPRGDDEDAAAAKIDPDSLFNLPKSGKEDDDEEKSEGEGSGQP